MMKKRLLCFFGILLIVCINDVKAITLKEYEDKVRKYQNEVNAAKAAIRKTEGQIASTKNEITSINNQVKKLDEEIVNMREEVEKGKEEIKEKSLQVKQFFSYLQMANGENAYLEYAFGADNVTDFIYRMSIVEQMTDYNNEVIEDLENMIERNAKREIEIKKKEKDLASTKQTLGTKVVSLGEEKASLESGGMTSAQELKNYQELVTYYKKKGCKSSDVIGVDCAVTGSAGIFRRPVKTGMITSEFGGRWGSFHRGVDITSPNRKKEKIYPVANGTVIAKYNDYYGALVLMIEHYDSKTKKWYTSDYCHMSSYAPNIKVGTYVTSDQYIGYMGNTGYVLPRPTRSNPDAGTHLHMEIAPCRYGKDNSCGKWSTYVSFVQSQALNKGFKGPRALINFPKAGVKWTTR